MRGVQYGIVCSNCGKIELSQQQYEDQMDDPDARWSCPKCGDSPVDFDDDLFEESLKRMEEEHHNYGY